MGFLSEILSKGKAIISKLGDIGNKIYSKIGDLVMDNPKFIENSKTLKNIERIFDKKTSKIENILSDKTEDLIYGAKRFGKKFI